MVNPHVPSIEHISTFAKRKGFVFQGAEIYGGFSGFFDYGPLGAVIKNELKQDWLKRFVYGRQDMVLIDGTTITSAKIWEASGHLAHFSDVLVEDIKTKKKYRADHLAGNALKQSMDGKSAEELYKIIKENNIKSPDGNPVQPSGAFNLMFPVQVGADTQSVGYLRGETAQSIFANFKNVVQTSRQTPPFGIAQIGRAYRNEIAPRDFLFRTREFEQMEIEYFYDPEDAFTLYDGHPEKTIRAHTKHFPIAVLMSEHQDTNMSHQMMTIAQLVEAKKLNKVHAYWLAECLSWFYDLGIKPENLRLREHTKKELSHYSSATFDIEYDFPQFGFKEIFGIADRGQFDLTQHQTHSKENLSVRDDRRNKVFVPHVIEPSFGLDRAFLAVMCDTYEESKEREQTLLHLQPKIAPYFVGIFPLVKKLSEKAEEVMRPLQGIVRCFYDESGSIGRRYARQDEIGTPYCITIDFDSLNDGKVTIRDRDSTEQKRIAIDTLPTTIAGLYNNTIRWESL